MTGLDFELDPETLDLVLDGAGFFVMSGTASAAVIYQMRHKFNAWPIDPTAGNTLEELAQLGADEVTLELMRVEILRAFRVLEDEDLVANADATARETQPGGFDFESSFRDQSSGRRLEVPVEPFALGSG